MSKRINSDTFLAALRAAGLAGLPFSWGEDGSFQFPTKFVTVDGETKEVADLQLLPQDKRDAILATYAAHQPDAPEAAQAQAWERIKAERDRRTQLGGYQVAGKWFHSDTFSRTQQLGLVMLGANLPAGTQWKTMDGSFVPMTQQLAGQVFAAAAASDIAIFAAAEQHRTAMLSSDDPLAYDYSGGWPPAYGG